MDMNRFKRAKNTRRESNGHLEKFRGGRLNPLMCVPFGQNEGGVVSQQMFFELGPVAGRLLTAPNIEIIVVGSPVQAIYALANPTDPHAHLTDVIRQKLLSGEILFPLENDNEIAQRCGINPKKIGGVLKVSSSVRIGHNAAVNMLRLSKYWKASLLTASNSAVTPALLGSTALQRLNGVLSPDDRINGAVQLDIPSIRLPIQSWTAENGIGGFPVPAAAPQGFSGGPSNVNPFNWSTLNGVWAKSDGLSAGNVSLLDFRNAQKQDMLVREMDAMMKANPVDGADAVAAWAHGLGFESHQPVILAQRTITLGPKIIGASDTTGVQQDIMRSDMSAAINITFPVPSTELGMLVYTFASLKPEETLGLMPHPILTEPWAAEKMVEEEFLQDPVPVLGRDLDTAISTANESTVYMHVGHNALKKLYVQYGLGRRLPVNSVQNKTAIWQYRIPLSVTPDSILYPAFLSHYPFSDNGDTLPNPTEVCTVHISSTSIIRTPMIEGPTPVEALPTELSNIVEEGVN